MNWQLLFSRQAVKDARKLANANMKNNAQALFEILRANPFQSPRLTKSCVETWLVRVHSA